MRNNSMKKYILEFLAAALLVMAIIGASKYQQKEAIADSSASDGKSAATTESTDNKTALTTSGTEETKTESQSSESSTEAQGSTTTAGSSAESTATSTGTNTKNNSNTTNTTNTAGNTNGTSKETKMDSSDNKPDNVSDNSKDADATEFVIGTISFKAKAQDNETTINNATVKANVKIASESIQNDLTLTPGTSGYEFKKDISGYSNGEYDLEVEVTKVIIDNKDYNLQTGDTYKWTQKFRVENKAVSVRALFGEKEIKYIDESKYTYSYQFKEAVSPELYTKSSIGNVKSELPSTVDIYVTETRSPDNHTESKKWDKAASVVWNDKVESGTYWPYDWKGVIKAGTIVNPSDTTKSVVLNADITVTAKVWVVNSTGNLTYTINFSINGETDAKLSKLTQVYYTITDYSSTVRKAEVKRKKIDEDEYEAYITGSISKMQMEDNYYSFVFTGCVYDGMEYEFDSSDLPAGDSCTIVGPSEMSIDSEVDFEIDSTGYSEFTIVKCPRSDGFVTDDSHTSLSSGGKISTSTLNDSGAVGTILKNAYKNNKNFRNYIDAIDDPEGLSLSLIMEAKELSSLEHESSMKDKARDFGSDSEKAELKKYFDLSLYPVIIDEDGDATVLDDDGYEITSAGKEISFTYTIPTDARLSSNSSSVYSRYFNIVRYHNGAHSAGIDEYKKSTTTLNPKTSEFSEFALAYYDKSSSSSSSSSSRSSSYYGSSSMSGSASIADTIDKTNAPKTGDNFNSRKWIYFLVIGIVVALCSFILYQDTREFNEDRKQPKA